MFFFFYHAVQDDSNLKMKATEQYFPVVLFIMLYKVVLTFESVDEIRWYIRSQQRDVFPGYRIVALTAVRATI